MKRRYGVISGSLLVAIAAGITMLQAEDKKHVERSVIAARPADVETIEGIVTASYETISGGVGVPRDWARDRTLFDANSRSVAASVDTKSGAVHTEGMTEQEFADRSDALLVKTGFTEREIGHLIKRFGNVATVLSSYETNDNTGQKSRGVNIFQLYFDGKRWWILSMVWDDERPGHPIPGELLK
jgi:hypothetical protein